jgi:hypothetical protein
MELVRTTIGRQLLRHLAGGLIVSFGFAVCASSQTHHVQFRLQTRDLVEAHLHSFSTKNGEREILIRKWLAEAGCKDASLSEQPLDRELPPNVICVLPGETQEVIVVGAHTDKVTVGDGVVDNWTGAVLLPALFYSLSAKPRQHTIIFVGFSAEEMGLIGSQYYVDHLSNEQRARIEGMVNFDSLGLSLTKVWASHADKNLLDSLNKVAVSTELPLTAENVDSVGATADSESFARYHIPRITLHSVTEQTWPILHSPSDKMAAINMNDYYDSYKLIVGYLAYLDDTLQPAAATQPAMTH